MAGGRFDILVGKDEPGVYVNFESSRSDTSVSTATRGTAIVPLPKATYGPAKQFIKLTNQNPDAAAAILGYSIYDNDANRQMLLIREAFKRAATVLVYILTEGKKATADITMELTEPETSELDTAVVAAISEKLGTKGELTGCTLSYSRRKRTLTVTLTGPVSGVKNTGVFDTLSALTKEGCTVKVDGKAITGLQDFQQSEAYTQLTALTEGANDLTFKVEVSKDDATENYTLVVSYPKAAAAAAASVIDPSEDTNSLTATAKSGGSRGNTLTVTSDANPVGGYDVIIHLDGSKVAEYEGLTTAEELIAENNPYIDFTGTGELGAFAGVSLAGGTDEEAANMDVTDFIDAWEGVKFNTAAFPFDGDNSENVKQAALTKIKYLREDCGKTVQVVIPNAGNMDYEGVINVTNSVAIGDDKLSCAEVCAWVAGATAGATNTQSLTEMQYTGATAVVNPKASEDARKAIRAGEFFFTVSDNDDVVVKYDINSLVTFAKPKDKTYRKNRVIRVYDTFHDAVKLNFPPGKYDNEPGDWDVMDGIGRTILREFADAGAIKNVDYEADFLVDREKSVDDETFFKVGLEAVDSSEKLYFTISTR